jgi:hypothetical protein
LDAVVYGPPLNTHCTAIEGPAAVRITTSKAVTRNHGSSGNEKRVANTLALSLLRVDDYNDCDGRRLTTKSAKSVLAEP